MQTAKKEVSKMLKNLPDDCTLEDIQHHLYVLQKISKGMEDIRQGRTYTQKQVQKKISKWLTR